MVPPDPDYGGDLSGVITSRAALQVARCGGTGRSAMPLQDHLGLTPTMSIWISNRSLIAKACAKPA